MARVAKKGKRLPGRSSRSSATGDSGVEATTGARRTVVRGSTLGMDLGLETLDVSNPANKLVLLLRDIDIDLVLRRGKEKIWMSSSDSATSKLWVRLEV